MANVSSSSVRRDLHRFFRRKIEIEKSRRISKTDALISTDHRSVSRVGGEPPRASSSCLRIPPAVCKIRQRAVGTAKRSNHAAKQREIRGCTEAVENELHNRSQVHTSSPTTALLAKTRRYCCASRCASHLLTWQYIDDVIIAIYFKPTKVQCQHLQS